MCAVRAFATAATMSAAALLATPQGAEAQIRCDGRFQIVRGQPLSTPYCEDNYLAAVAREYGVRVSGAAVRSDPSVKQSICRFVGRDSRVSDICVGYLEPRRFF